MGEFAGKVVLITGAAGNLGRAVGEAFRAAGAKLVLADRRGDRLDAIWEAAEDLLCVPVSLTEAGSVQAMVEAALTCYGAIDVVANVAGGFTMGPAVHETEEQTWDFMLDLNARSVFLTSRAVLPHMRSRGSGKIVNVAARAALEGKAQMGAYCVSKAAVITLTQSLAAENRQAGINVNCILPGTIDTPQNRADMPDADFGTWVPVAALADVILFLASDAARAVHGAALPVYGLS
jgi:NAD(P)-dependent dehydrogenase (short-subunit alcohol dehydrogenase family)